MPLIPNDSYSFVYHPRSWGPGPEWGPMRYQGKYRNGLRDGLWRVTDAEDGSPIWETTWANGEWHGPSTSWYRSGRRRSAGDYEHGCMSGVWTYWFENGQTAATGQYAADRKTGAWQYWDDEGKPMPYAEWEKRYHDYDWAYDDYAGMPRGENWPEPPIGD